MPADDARMFEENCDVNSADTKSDREEALADIASVPGGPKVARMSTGFYPNTALVEQVKQATEQCAKWTSEKTRLLRQRDHVADEKHKVQQREQYAEKIRQEEGREVRGYEKVTGETTEEKAQNARERDAERQRKARADRSDTERDAESDRKFVARKRAAEWTEQEIAAGLVKLKSERTAKRQQETEAEMPANFGRF